MCLAATEGGQTEPGERGLKRTVVVPAQRQVGAHVGDARVAAAPAGVARDDTDLVAKIAQRGDDQVDAEVAARDLRGGRDDGVRQG